MRKVSEISFQLILSVLLLCPAAQTASVQAQPPPKNAAVTDSNAKAAEAVNRRGFENLQKGDWTAAEADFAEVLKAMPRDVSALYGRALAQFNLRNYEQANANLETGIELLNRFETKNPRLADLLVLSAIISAVKNDNEAAIQKLEKAVNLVPTNFDANFSLARAYFGAGNTDKAVEFFRKAVTLKPVDIRSRFFLATALERAGQTAAALEQYREVLKIAPESAEGNLGLGVLLFKTEGNASTEAVEALKKAIAVNENLYEAQLSLGKALSQLKRFDEALTYLEKAAELAPANPEPHFQLALVYRKLGRVAEAEAQTEIVKQIHEKRRGASKNNPQ